jgi:hypothetical protein
MKHHTYNGICVLVVAKTAELNIVPLAIAFVACEATNHFLWIYLNMKAGGVPLDDMKKLWNGGL